MHINFFDENRKKDNNENSEDYCDHDEVPNSTKTVNSCPTEEVVSRESDVSLETNVLFPTVSNSSPNPSNNETQFSQVKTKKRIKHFSGENIKDIHNSTDDEDTKSMND